MIVFAELFMTGQQHSPFNAAMLQVLSSAYSQESIKVYTSRSHWDAIQSQGVSASSYNYEERAIIPNKSGDKWIWLRKIGNELRQVYYVFSHAKKSNALLCYAFLSPFAQVLLSLLCLWYHRQQVLVILHGLEIVKRDKQIKIIDKLYAFLLKQAFRLPSKSKKFIVLEKAAYDYLVNHKLLSKDELIYMPHPLVTKIVPTCSSKADAPIEFVHLGVARMDKQSQLFFKLATEFKNEISNKKVLFKVIGPVLPEMNPYLNENVIFNQGEQMLDATSYHEACLHADYAVFCYPQDGYELTSSGAVMDAIAYCLPILGFNNKSLDHLFSLSTTAPGKLYRSYEEMKNGVSHIIHNKLRQPNKYRVAFDHLHIYYSIEVVAAQLKKALHPWI